MEKTVINLADWVAGRQTVEEKLERELIRSGKFFIECVRTRKAGCKHCNRIINGKEWRIVYNGAPYGTLCRNCFLTLYKGHLDPGVARTSYILKKLRGAKEDAFTIVECERRHTCTRCSDVVKKGEYRLRHFSGATACMVCVEEIYDMIK